MKSKFRLDDQVEIIHGHLILSLENGEFKPEDTRPELVGKIGTIKKVEKEENREYGPGFNYILDIDGGEYSWFPEEHLKLHKKRL